MNKQEIGAVAILVAILLGWFYFQNGQVKKQAEARRAAEAAMHLTPAGAAAASATGGVAVATEETLTAAPEVLAPAAEGKQAVVAAEAPALPSASLPRVAPVVPAVERGEGEVVLSNEKASISISPWGGAIVAVELKDYWRTLKDKKDEGARVQLDFSERPSLALTELSGLSTADRLEVTEEGDAVVIRGRSTLGVDFTRTLTLGDGYTLEIEDRFYNSGDTAVVLPSHGIALGPMTMDRNESKMRGISFLGLDTLVSEGGKGVTYWAKSRFMHKSPLLTAFSEKGAAEQPLTVEYNAGSPVAWAAAKNKFFVQLLAPEFPAADVRMSAARNPEERGLVLASVWADVVLEGASVAPGDTLAQRMSYYVGPKKFELLSALGSHQADVMEFGMFSWMCKPLLRVLNLIYVAIPNYGIAIILLTALVRIIFWPVTHKSTESMKKMQGIQPLVTQLREKYKDNPQRMNQEVMALYKKHKVNPMAGCLPMVIQIPVFIALFTVLRSAIELRFAGFLWVPDLSEPERLLEFGFSIPFLNWDALNILPLFMIATMVWQQRLTPTTGDAQQQKMMMLMPVMMLVFFYNMPSALVLYWTTSQTLSIVQLILQKKRGVAKQAESAPSGAIVAVAPPAPSQQEKNRRRRQRKG